MKRILSGSAFVVLALAGTAEAQLCGTPQTPGFYQCEMNLLQQQRQLRDLEDEQRRHNREQERLMREQLELQRQQLERNRR
jgi:hypothetical protein